MDTEETEDESAPEWITIRALAARKGCSTRTVRRWIKSDRVTTARRKMPTSGQWCVVVRLADARGFLDPMHDTITGTTTATGA